MSAGSYLCKINNNSDVDVVVLCPPSGTTSTSVYQGATPLKLASGKSVIAKNTSDSVILNQQVSGQDATQYTLLVCDSSWLSPVANLSVTGDSSSGTLKFPDQTVTVANHAAMTSANNFEQTIQAFASGPLATGYQTAVGQATANASAAADGSATSAAKANAAFDQAIAAFFRTTKTFTNVTFECMSAIESYYNTLPCVWAEFASSVTYYLYCSSGSATTFLGTVVFTKPATLDTTKTNAGFSCVFAPAVNAKDLTSSAVNHSLAKSLTYSNGLFVDDPNADLPTVSLKGVFQLKSTFTQVSADNSMVPMLTGSVSSQTVLGADRQIANPDTAFWMTLFDPQGASAIFNAVMQWGNLIMTIQAVYAAATWFKEKIQEAKGKITKQELDPETEKVKAELKAEIDKSFKKLSKGDPKAKQPVADDPKPADVKAATKSLQEDVSSNIQKSQIESGLQKQAQNLEDIDKFASELSGEQISALESNAKSLREIDASLKSATAETLPDVVATQKQALDNLQQSTKSLTESVSETVGEANATTMNERNQAVEDMTKNMKEVDEQEDGDGTSSEGMEPPEGELAEVADIIK